MKRILQDISLIVLTVAAGSAPAQDVETALREGNRHFRKDSLSAAAQNYEQAAADQRGVFNWGDALYRQQQFDQAQQKFENAAAMAGEPIAQAHAFHNLGNSLLQQKKPEEAIKAYKEALKRNPEDDDTRYNLAYAQRMLKQQQQQQQNKDDQKKDDQQKQDQKKDDPQQDKKDQEQQKKDQEQQQQDQEQKQEQKEQQQQQQQQPKQGQIDPKDAERILDALNRQEKDVQDKVRAKQRVAVRVPIEKDW